MANCDHTECTEEGRNRLFINERVAHLCHVHLTKYEALREDENKNPQWKAE